jgi:hypothetical protein
MKRDTARQAELEKRKRRMACMGGSAGSGSGSTLSTAGRLGALA